jgi:hypothetical protein
MSLPTPTFEHSENGLYDVHEALGEWSARPTILHARMAYVAVLRYCQATGFAPQIDRTATRQLESMTHAEGQAEIQARIYDLLHDPALALVTQAPTREAVVV